MANEVWINLLTRDIKKSMAFYVKLGYNPRQQGPEGEGFAQLAVDDTPTVINLLEDPRFRRGSEKKPSGGATYEPEFIIDADSKDEVNDYYTKARNAGGEILNTPHAIERGYEFSFADPDGHRWKVLFREVKTPLIKSFFDGQDIQGYVES